MVLARPKPAAIAQPMPAPATPVRLPVPGGTRTALPMLTPVSAGPVHLRRCTFRRMAAFAPVRRGRVAVSYQVHCMYPGAESPVSLGDLHSAVAICDSCTAKGIFRPDED